MSVDSLYAYPLEKHEFRGQPNDFLCSDCRRPRAMHLLDGFKPTITPSRLPTDPGLYRGPHPHYRVGSKPLGRGEEFVSNPRRHAWALSEMKRQRQAMEELITQLEFRAAPLGKGLGAGRELPGSVSASRGNEILTRSALGAGE